MKTSSAGLSLIAKFEGEVLHPYKDIAGVLTIGIGHAIRAGESFPTMITHVQAIELLGKDVIIAECAINKQVKVPLTQDQFDALVSFTFNLGTGALASSTLLKLLNQGNYQGAADQFLVWCKAVINGRPTINVGLQKRRQAERAVFLTGVHPEEPVQVQTHAPVPVVEAMTGDAAADKIIGLVRCYVGCSLTERRSDLSRLVSCGVDVPENVVTISTNCATTALGIMALAGVQHPLLKKPYENGKAIEWVRQIGVDLGALNKYKGPQGQQPKPGSLLRYNIAGTNDDHVEWLLGPIGSYGMADHAGGGRQNNAITEENSNVWSNNGRPLVEWWDPDKLVCVDAPVGTGVPSFVPTPVVAPTPPPTFNWQAFINAIKFLFS